MVCEDDVLCNVYCLSVCMRRHYYSFIRDRDATGELGRWMMFNDSSVTFFNQEYLERETFGGEETIRYAGYELSR